MWNDQLKNTLSKWWQMLTRQQRTITTGRDYVERVEGNVNTGDHYHYHAAAASGDPEALRLAYLSWLCEQAGRVSLSGIDPKSAGREAETCLHLEAIYTALLTLSTEHDLQDRKGRDAMAALSGHGDRRLSALALLNRHPHLVLLGDPGSGKSTFVNFVTMCLAGELLRHKDVNLALLTAPLPNDEGQDEDERQPWEHGPLFPVQIILREFAARGLPPAGEPAMAKHVWTFLTQELENATLQEYAPHLQHLLRKQGGILFLDGLDEVPEAEQRRRQIQQAVEDFVRVFPRCRVLVTSRTYAYQRQEWRLQGFSEVVLAPFSKGQIRRFVERWYHHVGMLRGMNQDDITGRAELLKRAIFSRTQLYDFATRPLLLTLMASLHAWRGGSLPEKREELYNDTMELLLDWWESPKIVRDADGNRRMVQSSLTELLKVGKECVKQVLSALAFHVHATQADLTGMADIAQKDLVDELMRVSQDQDLRPGRLIEYLSDRAGLLIPRGVGIYAFPHRTFQEYLAACYLTDEEYPDKVAQLGRTAPNRWREVVLLAGAKAARGTLSAIWSLAGALCYQECPRTACVPLASETEDETAADASETHAVQNAWGALLSGQAIVEVANLQRVSPSNRVLIERIRNWLVVILSEQAPSRAPFPATERALAGNILARLGDHRPGVGVREDGLPDVEWCEIPAGDFLMGSDTETVKAETVKWEKLLKKENREDLLDAYRRIIASEYPQHTVWLSGYQISRYLVTNAQYQKFVEDGGYTEKWRHCWTPEGRKWKEQADITEPDWAGGEFDLSNHPVVGISWYEATAFCKWLTLRLQEAGVLTKDQEIRLPTEAEWEKAARGTGGRMYPWGNDTITAEHANYYDTQLGVTSAVGCFSRGASLYGCSDMIGNVWEWCWDWYDEEYYKKSPKENPVGPESGSVRVVRGGGWIVVAGFCRAAFRDWVVPGFRDFGLGFCLVRT